GAGRPEFGNCSHQSGDGGPEYGGIYASAGGERSGAVERSGSASGIYEDLFAGDGNSAGAGGARRRSGECGAGDRDRGGFQRHLGVRVDSGDGCRSYWSWRHATGAAAGRHGGSGKSFLQGGGSGFRDAAGCGAAEAGYSDGRVEGAAGKSERRVCAGNDGRGAGESGAVERDDAEKCGSSREAMSADVNKTNGNTTNGMSVAASELSLRGDVAANAPDVIEVKHIVKRYGDFTAVDDISFSVKEGEIFGLLGPNGAGKSTLIRMMTTLIPISSGSARVAGHDVAHDPESVRRTIGVIPQALTSDLDLTVEENLNIYAKLYDVPSKQRKEAIEELLETVDLTKWRGAQTKTLSGGMRRRLEIARGLVHSPKIFFLDEPTTGLDPVSRVAVWEMLTTIKSKRKLTILITTHYMDEADRLCNRIAIVDHGKLVALDTPEALKASVPGSNVIEAQFEHPPADWGERLRALPGVTSVQNESGGMFRVLTSNGSGTTTDLVEMAVVAKVALKTLTVQNTTLDDVFVYYTGRQLRDELVKAHAFVMPPRPGLQP